MTQRIVFEFLEPIEREQAKWTSVKKLLLDVGATFISEPTGKPPYLLTAVLPDETNAREIVARLRTTQGIGRADVDEWRIAL